MKITEALLAVAVVLVMVVGALMITGQWSPIWSSISDWFTQTTHPQEYSTVQLNLAFSVGGPSFGFIGTTPVILSQCSSPTIIITPNGNLDPSPYYGPTDLHIGNMQFYWMMMIDEYKEYDNFNSPTTFACPLPGASQNAHFNYIRTVTLPHGTHTIQIWADTKKFSLGSSTPISVTTTINT